MCEAMAQGMTEMAWAKNGGLDNAVPRTSENSTPNDEFPPVVRRGAQPAVLNQTEALASLSVSALIRQTSCAYRE
jgi:hypothetical protein